MEELTLTDNLEEIKTFLKKTRRVCAVIGGQKMAEGDNYSEGYADGQLVLATMLLSALAGRTDITTLGGGT